MNNSAKGTRVIYLSIDFNIIKYAMSIDKQNQYIHTCIENGANGKFYAWELRSGASSIELASYRHFARKKERNYFFLLSCSAIISTASVPLKSSNPTGIFSIPTMPSIDA